MVVAVALIDAGSQVDDDLVEGQRLRGVARRTLDLVGEVVAGEEELAVGGGAGRAGGEVLVLLGWR